jgi:hypothetical protein
MTDPQRREAAITDADVEDAADRNLEERLWRVIDKDGLANVPSDIVGAVSLLVGRIEAAWSEGYDAGFADTGEGWNGEMAGLNYKSDPYYVAQKGKTRAIAALKPEDPT